MGGGLRPQQTDGDVWLPARPRAPCIFSFSGGIRHFSFWRGLGGPREAIKEGRVRSVQALLFALLLGLALGCGGGGGGRAVLVFGLSGTVPSDGAIDAPVSGSIAVTFTKAADTSTLTLANIRLFDGDGQAVGIDLVVRAFNSNNLEVRPIADLEPNVKYTLRFVGAVRAAEGNDFIQPGSEVCFITSNGALTVRPDQVIDLGPNVLNIGRYLARTIQLADGRYAIFGGFTDENTATDTIEVWDPETRTFSVLATRMGVSRAEHTLTILRDGRVLIAGGVSSPGGEPLRSTEFFDPISGVVGNGPDMIRARRWHAAAAYEGGAKALITGGFGDATEDNPLDDGEILDGNQFVLAVGVLAGPSAQHTMATLGFSKVYVGTGNFFGEAGFFDGDELRPRREVDGRARSGDALRVDNDRIMLVGGDTRSCLIYDFGSNFVWGATDFLRDRRGAHTVTRRDGILGRALAAGGFQISAPGKPALRSLEVCQYLPVGPFGLPDVVVFTVPNVELPVAMAGHVGFVDNKGTTVLAGGFGGDTGPHLRQVVLILDAASTPNLACND